MRNTWEVDEDIQELLERARQLDKMRAKKERERKRKEYQGLNIFQRIHKRLHRKKTIAELSQEFTIGM